MRQMGARGPRTGRPTDQATALPISPPLDRDTNSQVIGGWGGEGGGEKRGFSGQTRRNASFQTFPLFSFSGAMSPTYTVQYFLASAETQRRDTENFHPIPFAFDSAAALVSGGRGRRSNFFGSSSLSHQRRPTERPPRK